ncbi:MAG TPA: AAA family ATPase [Ramlibacter sp.]
MYASYFGLKYPPFSIAPDPRYLFMSERHREALAHLLYGLDGGGGFVLLSGEIGTGKTTVCRLFLEQVPANCNVAYIFNPKLTAAELLQSVCDEFHIPVRQKDGLPPTVKDYLDPLNAFLLQAHAAGRNNVLIIDEAQNLSAEVLEQLRLLTNLETSERKLLQIILIGQPELRSMLARPELEQLAQRVIARYHLDALTPAETAQYVQHRCEVAGLSRPLPFERKALRRVHQLARGVPRRINLLCDRALLGAFANSQAGVDRATIDKAAAEVFDTPARAPVAWRRAAAILGLGLAAGAGLFATANHLTQDAALPPLAIQPAPAPAEEQAVAAPVAEVDARQSPATAAPPPALLHDRDEAWRELALSWNAEAGEGEPCKALQKDQLHCFSKNLNLALIRELGRPGVLTLDAGTGAPTYAVLTALTRDSATLRAGGTEQTVTLAALAARWQGDFATLWRVPPGYTARIGSGLSGETLEWIAAGLAAVDGSTVPSGRRAPDAAVLKTQLRSFQLAQGMVPDGQVGPMTFMQLNRVAGVEEPRLRTEP